MSNQEGSRPTLADVLQGMIDRAHEYTNTEFNRGMIYGLSLAHKEATNAAARQQAPIKGDPRDHLNDEQMTELMVTGDWTPTPEQSARDDME